MKKHLDLIMIVICLILLVLVNLLPIECRGEIRAELEYPAEGQVMQGIQPIYGWAVADTPIRSIELFIHGAPIGLIPYGSSRGDVHDAFPNMPNSDKSGFSMIWNWGILDSLTHIIDIVIRTDNEELILRRVVESVSFAKEYYEEDWWSNEIVIGGLFSPNKEERYDLTLEWRSEIQGYAVKNIHKWDNPLMLPRPPSTSEIRYEEVSFFDFVSALERAGISTTRENFNTFSPKYTYFTTDVEVMKRFVSNYGIHMGSHSWWLCTDEAFRLFSRIREQFPNVSVAFSWGNPDYAGFISHAFVLFLDINRDIWLFDTFGWAKIINISKEPWVLQMGIQMLFM